MKIVFITLVFLGFFIIFSVYLTIKSSRYMTYKELIDQLAESTGLPKTQVKVFVEDTISVLSKNLSRGTGMSIPDLGTFSTKVTEVKKVYNPHHEQYMVVPPKRVVEFSPSVRLKEDLKFEGGGDE